MDEKTEDGQRCIIHNWRHNIKYTLLMTHTKSICSVIWDRVNERLVCSVNITTTVFPVCHLITIKRTQRKMPTTKLTVNTPIRIILRTVSREKHE